MFGFHRRLVRRWECETDLPKPGPLPQTSQTAATVVSFPHESPADDASQQSCPGRPGNSDRVTGRRQRLQTAPWGYPRAGSPDERIPTVLQALDAAAIRRWAAVCVRSLDAQRQAIDGINVFPVADGDTGSNLLATFRAALESLLRAPVDERSEAGAALSVLAKGALAGARGNSGVIASQMLRGLAETLRDVDEARAQDLNKALVRAAELACEAVAEPKAGTMLTVLTASAA